VGYSTSRERGVRPGEPAQALGILGVRLVLPRPAGGERLPGRSLRPDPSAAGPDGLARSVLEDYAVSSKPPPLPSPLPSRATPLVNWSAVIASVAVSFALLVTLAAWIVTHPHRAAAQATSSPPVAVLAPDPISETPPPPPTPAVQPVRDADVEVVRLPVHDASIDRLAQALILPSAPPPLPAPQPPPRQEPIEEPNRVQKQPPAPPPGETYGTQVRFLNNPETAADLARHDRKLLFVVHISGNFEDSCFT
jgi:hypothetical protein